MAIAVSYILFIIYLFYFITYLEFTPYYCARTRASQKTRQRQDNSFTKAHVIMLMQGLLPYKPLCKVQLPH